MSLMYKKIFSHVFWKHAFGLDGSLFKDLDMDKAHGYAQLIVRVFYFSLFMAAYSTIRGLGAASSSNVVDPLWPIQWVSDLGLNNEIFTIIQVLFISASLLAFIVPQFRLVRILVTISLLCYSAYTNSFGKVDHGWHLYLWVSFAFVFLPNRKASEKALRYLMTFVFAQFIVLFSYTMSGFWKLLYGLMQWRGGETSIFSLDSLSNQVAQRLIQTNSESVIGDFIVQNEWPGFIMLLSAVFLELFSVLILFRSRLHQVWGLSLILMHTGIYLAMTISFYNSIVVVGLLFVLSPFAVHRPFVTKHTLADLPLIGNLFLMLGLFKSPSPAILFYDAECGVCSSFVQLLLRKGKVKNMRFAPIGGQVYQEKIGANSSMPHFDSIVYFSESNSEAHMHSRAIALALSHSAAPYKWGALMLFIPREIADVGYNLFARVRKRIFGEQCMLLSDSEQALFLS
jgi:predicted DCC family thiol-disulfide oxidoreductase YuxK